MNIVQIGLTVGNLNQNRQGLLECAGESAIYLVLSHLSQRLNLNDVTHPMHNEIRRIVIAILLRDFQYFLCEFVILSSYDQVSCIDNIFFPTNFELKFVTRLLSKSTRLLLIYACFQVGIFCFLSWRNLNLVV